MKQSLVVSFVIVIVLLISPYSRADVFQWTDNKGKKHYSDKDPHETGEVVSPEIKIENIKPEPVNAFDMHKATMTTQQLESIKTTNNERVEARKKAKKHTEENIESIHEDFKIQKDDWSWHKGVVKNLYFNSTITKTAKGQFILRSEQKSCSVKTFHNQRKHIINVNSDAVTFITVCWQGLVSQIPERNRGNRILDKHFSESTGSVDIGGVRYAVKGYPE